MKLVKKLAEEWSDPHFIDQTEGYDCSPAEAYEAGFRRALEFAQATYNNRHSLHLELNSSAIFVSLADHEVADETGA